MTSSSSSLPRARRAVWRRVVGFLVVGLGVAVAAACADTAPDEPCANIPAGGCPLSHGVACEDPNCEAVYACRSGGAWELAQRCPTRDAGATLIDGAIDDGEASAPAHDASIDASIDAPTGAWGGPGCGPLQAPDCPLGLALDCPNGCCGCEDLFVCEGGGWSPSGVCADGGVH